MITKMTHKILPSGLHAITDKNGRIHIYTEQEYQHMNWWIKVKHKYGWL